MQVRGMGTALGPQYNGALHALVAIVKNEGVAGLYRGIWANLCKWPCSERDPCATDYAESVFVDSSESRTEYRHLVFHLRVGEGKDSCALIFFRRR